MLPTKSPVLSNNCENVYAGLVSNWYAALVLLKDVLKTIVHTYTAVLVVGWWLWVDKKEIAIFPSDIIFHS